MPTSEVRSSCLLDISVVVATYRGAGTIAATLASLAQQSFAAERFEVLVVQNGPADATAEQVERIRRRFPALNVRLLQLATAGAGRARNLGMHVARGEFVTFVDDDDTVSSNYLAALFEATNYGQVGLALMADVTSPGAIPDFDVASRAIQLRLAGSVVGAEHVKVALGYCVAKLIPTPIARSVGFDADLRSGEDLDFFARLYARAPFEFGLVSLDANAVYYRTLRAGSISRQATSYDFNVTQRLDVIERLERTVEEHEHVRAVAQHMISGQTGFMNRFLAEHRGQRPRVLADIEHRELRMIPYPVLNKGLARDLAVLYAAPPYSDTSSIVAARRLQKRGHIIDVISSQLEPVRQRDPSLETIWAANIDRHHETNTRPVWISLPHLGDFCHRALETVERWTAEKGVYWTVYSRVMWPASHIVAGLYKFRYPLTQWTAEFSDPLLYDIQGKEKAHAGEFDVELSHEVVRAFAGAGFEAPDLAHPWEWIEQLAYAFADELIFTNVNQRDYMLSYCRDRRLAARALSHSTIQPHPIPEPRLYSVKPATYQLDSSRVNIGYFGRFYISRGLTEVVGAFGELSAHERSRLRLHVFTPEPDAVTKEVADAGLNDVIVAAPYVEYLEFLNLCSKFDVLLVNDAHTSATHTANPYLPSKYADYAGSGRPVWGIWESGSPLSTKPLAYASELGDVDGARQVLEKLAVARVPGAPDAKERTTL